MRTKKAVYNLVSGIALEVISVITGFILPRLILTYFGSSYNGMTASISQILGGIALLRAGIGGVTKAALYKPLVEKNIVKVSEIVLATEQFMRRISKIFIVVLFIFACIYPFFNLNEFDWLFTFSLVLILGIGTFCQYYFGITYQLLLQADQNQYILSYINIFSNLLNLVIVFILIKNHSGIHVVKLGSAIAFSLNPLLINLYVRRNYNIQKDVKGDIGAIHQRWDAFMHQLANFIHNNTDLFILTLFSNVKIVSIYTVYYLIVNSVRKIILIMPNALNGAFGSMIAKNQKSVLNSNVKWYEFTINSLAVVLYSTTAVLITPFIMIYTKNVNDVNYYQPIFGYIISLVSLFFCIRIPYQTIVEAAGHFKQTRNGAFVEAFLNLFISLILVRKYSLNGVAIGTLVAMVFRTLQYSKYMSVRILNRNFKVAIKRVAVSLMTYSTIIFISLNILHVDSIQSFTEWIFSGFITFILASTINTLFSYVFYKEMVFITFNKVFKMNIL